ncbi:MAG: 50S ribosomal protein L24 [Patescibacteria group bacterium]
MNIKKGDTVKIISGKDRGKGGKVTFAFPKEGKIVVEGLNIKKKHSRPKKQGQKGQIIQISTPFSVSSAMLVCPSCKKTTRIGKKMAGSKKFRVCKKCGAEI